MDIIKKKKRLVIGIMSGTSIDGVDVALVSFRGSGKGTKLNLIGYNEYEYPDGFKEFVLKNSVEETSNVKEIMYLNFIIPQIYKNAIDALLSKTGFGYEDIDLIGVHGQTIHHLPNENYEFGYNTSSTLQIGDPSVLAKITGILTVGDFRVADMALRGGGAPLVPYFDWAFFTGEEENRILLNIGGISNFTILPAKCKKEEVKAFDVGPGNMIIDALVKKFYGKEYDEGGEIASSGKVITGLFEKIVKADNFIEKKPPKSTGREEYGEEFIKQFEKEFIKFEKNDIIRTFTEFTVYSIIKNIELYSEIEPDEMIISGGGSKNGCLMKSLKDKLTNCKILSAGDVSDITPDSKEAVCFAFLANEVLNGNCNNLKSVTGAKKETIMGKICLP